jgi:hypothetical protein
MEIGELKDRLLLPKEERRVSPSSDICPICGESLVNKFIYVYAIEGHDRFVHPKCVAMLNTIKKHFPEIDL